MNMNINIIKRVAIYFKRHIFRDPKYFFTYSINYFNNIYVPSIKYYSFEDIPELLLKGKSIIRLGDGDVYTLNGGGQPYQKYDKELKNKIFQLITTYNDKSDYILCLNKKPLEITNRELKKLNLINCWLPTKVFYNLYFNKDATYHDAAMFYYLNTIPKYFEEYLGSKKIIIASNQDNIDKIKANNKIPFREMNFVVTPKINAFSDYNLIRKQIECIVNSSNEKDFVVLAALGPASKVLAFELSKNIQVIDVGHGIEVAYTNSGLEGMIP